MPSLYLITEVKSNQYLSRINAKLRLLNLDNSSAYSKKPWTGVHEGIFLFALDFIKRRWVPVRGS